MATMTGLKRFAYDSFVSLLRTYARIFLDLRVFGRNNIPGGAKIYAVNHICASDPYWMLTIYPEPVHILIGPGYKSPVMARVFDYFEQINTMPACRHLAVDKAVQYLRRGGAIYMAPEGDIQTEQRLGHFYPGVAKMYRRCPVPIVPIAVCTKPENMKEYRWLEVQVEGRVYRAVFVLQGLYVVNIGKPFMPEIRHEVDEKTDNARIMEEVKQRIAALLSEGFNYIETNKRP